MWNDLAKNVAPILLIMACFICIMRQDVSIERLQERVQALEAAQAQQAAP